MDNIEIVGVPFSQQEYIIRVKKDLVTSIKVPFSLSDVLVAHRSMQEKSLVYN